MTVSTLTSQMPLYSGNGTATEFAYTFRILDYDHLVVTQIDAEGSETDLALDTDFTATGVRDSGGGTVTLGTALPTGEQLLIRRIVPITQLTDYRNQGRFFPETHEDTDDISRMIDQQQQEQIDRALQLSATTDGINTVLPEPSSLDLIGWNEAADALINVPREDLVTTELFADFKFDKFTADGVQVDFLLSASPGVIANMDVSIDGVTQVPVDDYSLTARVMTCTAAPPADSVVLVRYGTSLPAVEPETGTGRATLITDSTTARTLSAIDAFAYIQFTNASAKTYTFASSAMLAMFNADLDEILVRNDGAGNLTLVAGSGITLKADYLGTLVVPQDGTVAIKIVSTTTAHVMGATVAA